MSTRTADDYRRAIEELVENAEAALEDELVDRDGKPVPKLPREGLEQYMEGLDLIISEEATLALRAEFLRYSTVFDTARSREAIHSAVAEVTKPLVEEWINHSMPDVARKVITDAIGQIAQVRATGALKRTK